MKLYITLAVLLSFTATQQAAIISSKSFLEKHLTQIHQHFDRVIKYLQNHDKIVIILGKGDIEKDYDNTDIHMMVSNFSSDERFSKHENFLLNKIGETARQPFLIPLDFNSKEFFNFIEFFTGRIDRLIFAPYTTQLVNWNRVQISLIYEVLRPSGCLIYPLNRALLQDDPLNKITNPKEIEAYIQAEIKRHKKIFENFGFDIQLKKDPESYVLICTKPNFTLKEKMVFVICVVFIWATIYQCFFKNNLVRV